MSIKTFESKALGEMMQHIVHKSGLNVYVFPKKGFSKYYAIYGTEYGSLNRTFAIPGESEFTTVPDGIAHYLEHKMFEDENGGNAFDKFAQTGASSNAFTSFNLTAYLFSCTDNFYENLDILLEFVNHPYFTEENVAKEQGIIGQEIKMYDDEPEWRVFFNTLTAMFHNNPVKIDIAGTVESISHITPEVLYKCYNTFYNPSNMTLVLVGDIDIEKALEYVDKHVSPEKSLGEIRNEIVSEPQERVREIVEQKLSVSRPMFRIGFKDNRPNMSGGELLKKEITTEIILEAIFGRSGDFFLEQYEKGLIDSSFASETELEKQYGYTLIGGESDSPEKVYALVRECIDKFRESGIGEELVERAKKVLISQNIRIYNSVENMGNTFIRRIMSGQNPLDYNAEVEKITKSDVDARLREHFDTSNCVLSIVRPN